MRRFLDAVPSPGVDTQAPNVAGAVIDHATFDTFAATDGERLRRALVARYGVDVGNDVCNDALAYAWEHWERVGVMGNAVGYLFRVAQSSSRRHFRWHRRPVLPAESSVLLESEAIDRDLGHALARLNAVQRTSVVLVHVYGWSYAETARTLRITEGAVRNHVHRGLRRLRVLLELP